MLQDDIAYLRLRAFYENSDEAMEQLLREIQGQGVRGVVLDLRNNPGRPPVDVRPRDRPSSWRRAWWSTSRAPAPTAATGP